MTSIEPGMKVRVHFNLHRGDYAVTIGGKVAAYVEDITLTGVRLHVGKTRFTRDGNRTVHAWAWGIVAEVNTDPDVSAMTKVRYNPHRAGGFATADGAQIDHAERITFKAAAKDGSKVGYGYLHDR